MSRVVLVTDGSAPAFALASWLSGRLGRASIVEARGAGDVARVVEARAGAGQPERVVAVAGAPVDADVHAEAALETAKDWLAPHAPFDVRSFGPRYLEERRLSRAPGAESLDELLARLAVPRRVKLARPARRGSDPFRGVGFAVCTALLLAPERAFTERALAAAAGHAQPQIHRVLKELEARGFVERRRGGSRLRNPLALRDALLASWRDRVGRGRRRAVRYTARRRGDVRKLLVAAARKAGAPVVLAGHAAATNPDRLVDEPIAAYLDGDANAILEGAFERSQVLGDVELWEPLEPAVFAAPRRVDGLPVTNRVVTFLDLASYGSDRSRRSAESEWSA